MLPVPYTANACTEIPLLVLVLWKGLSVAMSAAFIFRITFLSSRVDLGMAESSSERDGAAAFVVRVMERLGRRVGAG